jgi:hypothetical protein
MNSPTSEQHQLRQCWPVPMFHTRHIGLQLPKIKCGVDVFAFDVLFNPSKFLSKTLASVVVLLDGAHSLSVTFPGSVEGFDNRRPL